MGCFYHAEAVTPNLSLSITGKKVMQLKTMLKYRLTLSICTLLICMFSLPSIAQPKERLEYNIVGNPLPPFSIDSDGLLHGFSIELLTQIISVQYGESSVSQTITMPFARVLQNLQSQKKTIAVNIACTSDRKTQYKWLGPYYDISMDLIGKVEDKTQYTDLTVINRHKVVVVRDTALKEILLRRGLPANNLVEVSNPEQAITMLNAGRVSLIAHIPNVLDYIISQSNQLSFSPIESKYKLQNGAFYFALSHDFEDADIIAMQQALNEFLFSETGEALLAKYRLKAPSLNNQDSCTITENK